VSAPIANGRLRNNRTGQVTISGLSRGDCRLIAQALRRGAYEVDGGGPLSAAIDDFARLLTIPATFPEQHTPVDFVSGFVWGVDEDPDSVPDGLFTEIPA
jgi:hypothetical protein